MYLNKGTQLSARREQESRLLQVRFHSFVVSFGSKTFDLTKQCSLSTRFTALTSESCLNCFHIEENTNACYSYIVNMHSVVRISQKIQVSPLGKLSHNTL